MHTTGDRDHLARRDRVGVVGGGESVVVELDHVLDEVEPEVEAAHDGADTHRGGRLDRARAAGGSRKGRVGALQGLGDQAARRNLVVLAHVREHVVEERAADQLDALTPLGLVLGRVHLKRAQGERGVAAPGTKLDTAVGQDVLGRHTLRDAQRMVHPRRQQRHQVDEPHPARQSHQVRVKHFRSGDRSRTQSNMLLGTTEGIEANPLRKQNLLHKLPVAVLMRKPDRGVPLRHEDEVHTDPSVKC
ncbi:hypothetical protein ABNG14_34495 [Streptomyces rapamycinicus]